MELITFKTGPISLCKIS